MSVWHDYGNVREYSAQLSRLSGNLPIDFISRLTLTSTQKFLPFIVHLVRLVTLSANPSIHLHIALLVLAFVLLALSSDRATVVSLFFCRAVVYRVNPQY